ncbi:helix-hairpin-helix domain-containing protein [Parabacteroides sp. PF5-9]|uniref:helix-hairpin-helix domain-containing protein n=1 Tax=Parabacteroides sp. PF5-9 TaxID=1742404 RepID=UPI00247333FC|nr:helix-hairpin-helix domain-containing protein [Parabacteroides sp. PF5-9]MDH6356934.1 competence protein ComEA [Parabacteroides sp. PF5-9]
MNWRDFLYFSSGERRALTLLAILIVIAWLLLILTDKQKERTTSSEIIVADTLLVRQNDSLTLEPDSSTASTQSVLKKVGEVVLRKEMVSPRKKATYPRVEKYPDGTLVELNSADTTMLKKVPGIGSSFSNRIVKYRQLLGGFYTVSQLGEVYGIDEDRYKALEKWFTVNPQSIRKRSINSMTPDSLYRHPYINARQAKAILNLRRQKGKLTGWDNLHLLEEFTESDLTRIKPYLSFE